MNKILSIILIFHFTILNYKSNAQMNVEDSKGQSTILYRASNISLDFGETTLSANWNNLRKLALLDPAKLVWGINARTKNKDGLAELFNKGILQPDSKLEGFVGIRLNYHPAEYLLRSKINSIQNSRIFQDVRNVGFYASDMVNLIKRTAIIKDYSKRNIFQKVIEDRFNEYNGFKSDIDFMIKLVDKYDKEDSSELKNAAIMILDSLNNRMKKYESLIEEQDNYIETINELESEITESRKNRRASSLTIFLNGGLNANNLIIYNPQTVSTFRESFDTSKFRGGFIDIGCNLDYGSRWTFGITGGYERFNNIDSLEINSYTFRDVSTQGQQQLIEELKYSAYPGSYIVYDRINLKFDALYYGDLSDDHRFVLNTLFLRMYFPLSNTKSIKQVIIAGTGINFYKKEGKLVGGIYLQSNDLFNNLNSDRAFFERVSFGLVAKYAFTTILDRF